jgi:hypothetical protein
VSRAAASFGAQRLLPLAAPPGLQSDPDSGAFKHAGGAATARTSPSSLCRWRWSIWPRPPLNMIGFSHSWGVGGWGGGESGGQGGSVSACELGRAGSARGGGRGGDKAPRGRRPRRAAHPALAVGQALAERAAVAGDERLAELVAIVGGAVGGVDEDLV